MNYGTFQTLTLIGLGVVGFTFGALIARDGRRDREAAAARMTGIPPDGHPDLDMILSDDDQDELNDIAARWNDKAGLAIFENTEGETA